MTPIKHGRYSKITRPRIKELIDAFDNDPNPLDTEPELAAARALFQDFIERYDQYTEALLAWHQSYEFSGRKPPPPEALEALKRCFEEYEEMLKGGDGASAKQQGDLDLARKLVTSIGQPVEGKPRTVLDISDASKILDRISAMVKRIEDVRRDNTITYDQVKRFLFGIDRVLEARVKDAKLLEHIRADILAIQVT